LFTTPIAYTKLFSNIAADALASQVTDEDRESGLVYPPLNRIRQTSLHVGKAVANMAYKLGMSGSGRRKDVSQNPEDGLFILCFMIGIKKDGSIIISPIKT
jgi:hypothetical protein